MMRHLAKAVATGAHIVLLAISASAARAQTPNKPAPPASERTAHLIEAFERQVEADRNALKMPGLSTVVIQDGEVLSARGFGYADVEHRIPATPDTLYLIASVTKTFTAILVLRLVEQGQLDLDEPVSRYSADFKDDSVKIKHLLSHTSEGTPGEKFSYNPERFEYLKAILEKRTGKGSAVQYWIDSCAAVLDATPAPAPVMVSVFGSGPLGCSTVIPSPKEGMALWRERLFGAMTSNARAPQATISTSHRTK